MEKITAIINSKIIVAESTYQINFELKTDGFSFKAGQRVKVTLPKLLYPDNTGNTREFSIVSTPSDKGIISIAFRVSEGGFERTLIESKIGSEVSLLGPVGSFVIPDNSKKSIVFIAGGIGIAPLMSMIREVVEKKPGLQIILLYANSRLERAAYLPELGLLADQNPNLQLYSKYGYIDVDFIKHNVVDIENNLWFVSGPLTLINSVTYLLQELGVKEEDIFSEEIYNNNVGFDTGKKPLTPLEQEKIVHDVEALLFTEGAILGSQILDVLSRSAFVSVTNTKGVIVYVNDLFNEISGYSDEEIIGQNHNIVKSDYHTPDFYKQLWETILAGKVWRGEVKNKAKDGSMYWIDSSISPIFGKDGNVSYYIAVDLLITDKKNAEEELRLRKELLESTVKKMEGREGELEDIKKATLNILEDLDEEKKAVEKRVEERTLDIQNEKAKLLQVTSNMKSGAVLLNNAGEVIFVNKEFYVLLARSQMDIRNSSILEVLEEYFSESDIKDFVKRCISGETFTVPEVEHGEKIYELFFHCLKNEVDSEKIEGYFILIDDITDAKLLERSKSELVAVASHQLRTPLTAMRGNIEMLIDESYGQMNTEQHELIRDIDVSTKRLISMVNDMLDITKIERGNLDMVFVTVNIRSIIDSICNDLDDYVKRRGITIIVNVPEELEIYGDKSRVRQVLQNLIDNAVKYSKNPGTLDISSHVEGEFAQIVMKDDGLGIPKLEQSRIFGRFYRASNTANSSSSGSGLGLYIVRSIVSQLGGDIWFESEEGVGTTFFLTLPITEIKTEN